MLMVLIFIDYLWGCQEDLVLCLNFSSLEKMNVLFPSPPYPVLLCIDSRVNCFILPNTFWLYFLSPSLHVWERKKLTELNVFPSQIMSIHTTWISGEIQVVDTGMHHIETKVWGYVVQLPSIKVRVFKNKVIFCLKVVHSKMILRSSLALVAQVHCNTCCGMGEGRHLYSLKTNRYTQTS